MPIARIQPQGEFIEEEGVETLSKETDGLTATDPNLVPGLPKLPPGWLIRYNQRCEWRPRDLSHPAYGFVERTFKKNPNPVDLTAELNSLLSSGVTKLSIPVLYVDDEKGFVLKDVATEERFELAKTNGSSPPPSPSPFKAWVPGLWILHRPTASVRFQEANYQDAMKLAFEGTSFLHKNLFLRAREKLETASALQAFDVLFKHMSMNEELWRLEQLMANLSFDLEDHPEMEKYRGLLAKQIGHLRGGAPFINGEAIHNWYKNESPPAGFSAEYVKNAVSGLAGAPTRLRWLFDECKRENYQKIAEYGSADGVSLVYLTAVEGMHFTGYEANPKCIESGKRVARECGVDLDLRPMEQFSSDAPFDAVALFEFLEHNDPDSGAEHARRCFSAVRPGGTLYITTPCGNWSAFDEHTRDVELRKDHIYSFTPRRMLSFLSIVLPEGRIEQCERVENPVTQEANAWAFAKVRKVE